jgi:hypothetical protein
MSVNGVAVVFDDTATYLALKRSGFHFASTVLFLVISPNHIMLRLEEKMDELKRI